MNILVYSHQEADSDPSKHIRWSLLRKQVKVLSCIPLALQASSLMYIMPRMYESLQVHDYQRQ